MKTVRLGFINYINTVPVYYGILTGKIFFGGELVKDIPANLNKLIRNGKIHISPVSSIEYINCQKDYYLMPSFCINSTGYVKSVLLVSKYPVTELSGKTIGLTPASETSRALLKILLSDYFNINPLYIELQNPNLTEKIKPDAALLIGDHALKFKDPDYPYSIDIANIWKEKTDHTVVFAVWVVRRDFFHEFPEKVHSIEKILLESYEYALKDPEGVIKLSSIMCPDITCSYEDYFKNLSYDFNNRARESLLFFYDKLYSSGVITKCDKLEFYDFN